MRFVDEKIADEGALTANTYLYEVDFKNTASAAFYAKWTKTTVTGTIIAQYSCNGSDWVDIGSSADINAVLLYTTDVVNKGYRYLRLKLVVATGSLTSFSAWYNAKG